MNALVGEERLNSFFETLSEELSDGNWERLPAFARDRQIARMRKRARFCRPDLTTKAIASFLEDNARVGSHSVVLDPHVLANAKYFVSIVLERFTKRLNPDTIQESLDLPSLLDLWRFGPGASNGVRGSHAVEKISQDMTCTTLGEPWVLMLRRNNVYFRIRDDSQGSRGVSRVPGSRLTTVPKNEDTERTIAIEPSGNMVLQLAAGRYLEGVLAMIGLDITKQQPLNKALALRGSKYDSLATIDLKSASNMIKPDLVRALFPAVWFKLLMDLRSPSTELPDGRSVELNMISTMGNGYTFPLMTLIIAALLYGYRCTQNGPSLFIDWRDSAIFGDDIIIPNHEYSDFCRILEGAGFVVNHDKSYCSGPFRESCGGDYYEGFDVTPFYVKSLSTQSDVFVAINQVFEWCAKVHHLLPRTLLLLKSYLRKVHLVPEWFGPEQGIRTSLVAPRFTYLQIQVELRKLPRDSHFALPLICGGYLEAKGPDMFYGPRQYKTRVKVRSSRLPKGFRDGGDPLSREPSVTTYVSSYISLLFKEV